jgi:2-amino-4-hydroxy-6-hydroxymethyldihydropteridine diphosphokinase
MRHVGNSAHSKVLLIGLGANVAGRWGSPQETFTRARRELTRAGIRILRSSNCYWTKPLGDTPQPPYLNAVLLARANMAPGTLLRLFKRIERAAGRRTLRAMASRPLDLDVLDYMGRRIGWPVRRRARGRLILPHPEMHARAFVLVPLQEVAPAWRHPVWGRSAKALLVQLPPSSRASVRQALDSAANTCDKVAS